MKKPTASNINSIIINDLLLFKQETKTNDMTQANHVALEKTKIKGINNEINMIIEANLKYLLLLKIPIEKSNGKYKTK
jgi:hypothetical protein